MRGICHDTAEGEKYSHQLEGQKPSWQEEDNEEEWREGESLIALNNISTVSQWKVWDHLMLQSLQLN